MLMANTQTIKHLPKSNTSAQLRKTITLHAAAFNKSNSKILVSSNETGIYNVYEITLNNKKSVALTTSKDEAMYAVDYLKGSNKFIYASDIGGNEENNLLPTVGSSISSPWRRVWVYQKRKSYNY